MDYKIREIKSEHDKDVCKIIQLVGKEYGAIGEGFGPSDLEVHNMSKHYNDECSSRYIVASIAGRIVGGCGIAAFNNSHEVCELRKLFLLPESRGLGIGAKLTEESLKYAKSKGYKKCYLDTLNTMKDAITLYKKQGFVSLDKPLNGTIHNGCDVWMLKTL